MANQVVQKGGEKYYPQKMISIIISTYRPELFNNISKNIEATVGVPYEIIPIENKGLMGLCKAYNIGAERAKYDILCFAHEDINIQTKGWGEKINTTFRDNEKVGLIGVVGSKYKPFIPSGWSHPYADYANLFCSNIIQYYKDKTKLPDYSFLKPLQDNSPAVVSVDGVFFCTKKNIATECLFDQDTFKSFHCYDVDFSLQVFQHYQVIVTYDILIEHFSEGSFDKSWIDATLSLHTKWGGKLPLTTANISRQKQKSEEYNAFLFLYMISVRLKYDLKKIHVYLFKNNRKLIQVMGLKNFLKMHTKLFLSYIKPVK